MRTLWMLIAAPALLFAQAFRVEKGAADYQVYQRDASGFATLELSGTVSGSAATNVEARVLAGETVVKPWSVLGPLRDNAWSGKIERLPTGGPYTIEFRAGAAKATLSHILVGDLWILAGQSNMEGWGNLENLPEPSPQVNSFDMTDMWGEAREPLHRLVDAINRVHWQRGPDGQPRKLEGSALDNYIRNRKKGAGVGLMFAKEMTKRTGVPVGLIPCAHGGTSMDQWSPALLDRGGDSLYGGMVRRHQAAGGRVRGVLWYQGESDANPKAAPLFEQKFKDFVASARRDFAQPDLPFYYVQIGRHVTSADGAVWNAVQEAQRKLEPSLAPGGMTSCIDCRLDDGIHVGTDDYALLAERFANLACHDLYPKSVNCSQLKRGPRPVSARYQTGVITVEFTEVNGKLTHAGRLTGFSLHDKDGRPLPAIYRQRLSPGSPNVVELLVGGELPAGATLYYGWGRDPLVNLVDEARMPAPVFGPMAIER